MLTIHISKKLFWDIDLNTLDEQNNKRLIIERVFTLGDLSDIENTIRYFGIDTIKKEIIKAGFLDSKSLHWVSKFLNIPKTKFQCFTKMQLNQPHWNY